MTLKNSIKILSPENFIKKKIFKSFPLFSLASLSLSLFYAFYVNWLHGKLYKSFLGIPRNSSFNISSYGKLFYGQVAWSSDTGHSRVLRKALCLLSIQRSLCVACTSVEGLMVL